EVAASASNRSENLQSERNENFPRVPMHRAHADVATHGGSFRSWSNSPSYAPLRGHSRLARARASNCFARNSARLREKKRSRAAPRRYGIDYVNQGRNGLW